MTHPDTGAPYSAERQPARASYQGCPIPFAAFAPRQTATDGAAGVAVPYEIDEIRDVIDSGLVPSGCPQQPPGPSPAGTGPLPERAPAGRVLIAVLPTTSGDAEAEVLATRACRAVALSVPPPIAQMLAAHAPADDLPHWSRADALRAELAGSASLIVCAHEVMAPAYRHLVTIDAPAARARHIVRALQHAAPGGAAMRAGVVLTDEGWSKGLLMHPAPEIPDAELMAIRQAIVAQAHRLAGRALVFPGQQLLAADLALREVLSRTAIDTVTSPAGPAPAGAVVRCHGYARPRYRDGMLALAVSYNHPDLVAAVEVRYSRPCCAAEHP